MKKTSHVVLIDNFDSFTYNLAQRMGALGVRVTVVRNDKSSVRRVRALSPSHLVISPGPCTPAESGYSVELIAHFGPLLPLLGVCLGHQCIGSVYGASVVRTTPVHGKSSAIIHDKTPLYSQLAQGFQAGRYHSLHIPESSLPKTLLADAWTKEDHLLMGIHHRDFPTYGVQFHPESILTPLGSSLLHNFLSL